MLRSTLGRLKSDAIQSRLAKQASESDLEKAQRQAKYWRHQAYRLGNQNQQLKAAQEERAGAISKIASESMWVKETGTLSRFLERWQPEDRPELCYRALFRARGENGERLAISLADLEGGMFDKMKQAIYLERDWQIAAHMQKVFSARKADTLRVCSGVSWNIARWWRDTWKWDWTARDAKTGELKKKRQMLAPDSQVPMPEPIPIVEMKELETELLQGDASNVHGAARRWAWRGGERCRCDRAACDHASALLDDGRHFDVGHALEPAHPGGDHRRRRAYGRRLRGAARADSSVSGAAEPIHAWSAYPCILSCIAEC